MAWRERLRASPTTSPAPRSGKRKGYAPKGTGGGQGRAHASTGGGRSAAADGQTGRGAASSDTDRTRPARPTIYKVRVSLAVGVVAALLGYALFAAIPRGFDPAAVAEAAADPRVTLTETDEALLLAPTGGVADTAVVFYPAARVRPESYVPAWAEIVADTGVAVFLPSMRLNIAYFSPDRAERVLTANPDVSDWWVGGHGLGGSMAAGHLGDSEPGRYVGFVGWAAAPAEGAGLAGRDDLVGLVVAGGADVRAPAEELAEAQAFLPPAHTFTVIDGMTHAQFGVYAPYRNEPPRTRSSAEVFAELAEVTGAALGSPPRAATP